MSQEKKLIIRMLGSFSLTWEGNKVREEDSRSRKMWLLLARLIYCRNRHISQEELIKLLWEDEPDIVNPYGAENYTASSSHPAECTGNAAGADSPKRRHLCLE